MNRTKTSQNDLFCALAILGEGTKLGVGTVPVTGEMLGSLLAVAYAQESSLEEFAAGLSAFCRVDQTSLCETLEWGFEKTELLNFDTLIKQ